MAPGRASPSDFGPGCHGSTILRGGRELPIPNTLVHGDFHAENIAVSDGRYLIFDWTDAWFAHPFVDLATFMRYAEHGSIDRATRARWRDHYLRGWEE